MSEVVRDAFRTQALVCGRLESPLMERVLGRLADLLGAHTAVGAHVLNWEGNPAPFADALALRLAAALHYLVLTGAAPELADAYAECDRIDDAQLDRVLAQTLASHAPAILDTLAMPPRANEVRRSAALIAAGHWLAARFRLPVVLSELGPSAGLNLIWDSYRLEANDWACGPDPKAAALTLRPAWRGAPPPQVRPEVIARAGVDLAPLDPVCDRDRILSYIWADQRARLDLTRAALDACARQRPPLGTGCAVDWLETRAAPIPGHLHVIFHSLTWQYLAPDRRARGETLIARAGKVAAPSAPVAHLSYEHDGSGAFGAALWVSLWPRGERVCLGRADFHGRWIDWQAPLP